MLGLGYNLFLGLGLRIGVRVRVGVMGGWRGRVIAWIRLWVNVRVRVLGYG